MLWFLNSSKLKHVSKNENNGSIGNEGLIYSRCAMRCLAYKKMEEESWNNGGSLIK